MKNKLSFLLTIISIITCVAQVGIGTSTPNAMLDINSTDQGLLIPRVQLTAKNVSAPVINSQGGALAESTLVYNTATAGTSPNNVVPGYYFWNGTSWSMLSVNTGSGNYWSLTGNTVTDTDFLGTLNYKPIVFKVNAQVTPIVAGTIYPSGSVALVEGASTINDKSFAAGYKASAKQSESTAIGSASIADGYKSIAIGPSTTTGSEAIAIGSGAVSSGNESIAIGGGSTSSSYRTIAMGAGSNASSSQAMAFGKGALAKSNESFAIGSQAQADINSSNSIALGFGSYVNSSNAIAIGYQASTSQYEAIVLGSSSASSSAKVGIGTNSPTNKLHVAGKVRIADGSEGVGKVLTSDANGVGTWIASSTQQAYGSINNSGAASDQSVGSAGDQQVSLITPGFFLNTSTSNNGIQVTKKGIYRVSYNINLVSNAPTSGAIQIGDFYSFIADNSTELTGNRIYINNVANGQQVNIQFSRLVSLLAWQTVTLYVKNTQNFTILRNGTFLDVELIKELP